MPLYIGQRAAEPTDVYVGTREVNQIFQGDNLVWSHGSLPAITDFAVAPPYLEAGTGGRTIQLAFIVSGSQHNTITNLTANANVPLTSNTGVTGLAAPGEDTVYRLRCYLASTATGRYSHRDVKFWRVVFPVIESFTFGTVQTPVGVTPRLQGQIRLHPWSENPVFTLTNRHGFPSTVRPTGTGNTRNFLVQGNTASPGQSISDTFTLTVQLRLNGVNIGSLVSRSVQGSW